MGAGGMGGCLGALLAWAGADVTLIARGSHLSAMQRDGLRIIQQGDSFTVPVNTTSDPAQAGPVDLVISRLRPTRLPRPSGP